MRKRSLAKLTWPTLCLFSVFSWHGFGSTRLEELRARFPHTMMLEALAKIQKEGPREKYHFQITPNHEPNEPTRFSFKAGLAGQNAFAEMDIYGEVPGKNFGQGLFNLKAFEIEKTTQFLMDLVEQLKYFQSEAMQLTAKRLIAQLLSRQSILYVSLGGHTPRIYVAARYDKKIEFFPSIEAAANNSPKDRVYSVEITPAHEVSIMGHDVPTFDYGDTREMHYDIYTRGEVRIKMGEHPYVYFIGRTLQTSVLEETPTHKSLLDEVLSTLFPDDNEISMRVGDAVVPNYHWSNCLHRVEHGTAH